MRKTKIAVAALVGLLTVSVVNAKNVEPYFDFSGQRGFFKMPFPNDVRRNADGTINLQGFPPTLLVWILGTYPAVAEKAGFSTAPTIYFRFNGPVNTTRLPKKAKDSISPDSPIMLIDIDPRSPEFGKKFPLLWKFYDRHVSWASAGPNLLALMPVPGYVLRENTTYAALVLKSLGAKDGELTAPKALDQALAGKQLPGQFGKLVPTAYEPLRRWLEGLNCPVRKEEIAAATVFTTGNPTAEMLRMWHTVQEMPLVQLVEPLKLEREYPDFYVLRSKWRAPQFQTGFPPFSFTGGEILYDRAGKPVIQRFEDVPLVITIPKQKMPEKGFPLMLFIHGTAGSASQVVDRGKTFDPKGQPEKGKGPAMVVARRGIASAGSSVPQSGERGGDKEMIFYYCVFNAAGMKGNLLQSAAEQMMVVRLLKEIRIPGELCPEAQVPAGRQIFFDPELFLAMGQSLGSLILVPFAGVEPAFKAVIPSGEGGHWGIFIARGNILDFQSLNQSEKGMFEAIKVDSFHPGMSVFQNAMAPVDPISFAPHIIKQPLQGEPKQVWMSIGLYDHFFRPETQNALFAGLGLDLAGKVVDDRILQYLELEDRKIQDYPVSGNLKVDSKNLTGVAVQYKMDNILDGHHVNFQFDETKYQYGCFLQSVVKDGLGKVYAPKALDSPCVP
jgi:hypothetical protein